jgi:hypothetical protein
MKSKYLAPLAAGLVLAVPASLAADNGAMAATPPVHEQRIMSSADGGVCRPFGDDGYRCRSFVAVENWSPTGDYIETRASINQHSATSTGYRYRYLECPIDRNALTVTPNRASVQVVMDSSSPLCNNYGEIVTFEPWSVEPWPFQGAVVLEADLLDPRYQDKQVTTHSWKDNALGTSWREHCQGGSGYGMSAGGMNIAGVYFPFGPEDTSGQFYMQSCGSSAR